MSHCVCLGCPLLCWWDRPLSLTRHLWPLRWCACTAQAITPAGEETGLFDVARYEAEQRRRSEARQDIKAAHKAVLAAGKAGPGGSQQAHNVSICTHP